MTKVWEFPCGAAWAANTAAEAAAELRERNEDDVYDGRKAKLSVVRDTNDFEAEFGLHKHRIAGTESRCTDWLETFGRDLRRVDDIRSHPDPKVSQTLWTVVEGDDNLMWLTADYHYVNRIYYVISKKPWVTGQEVFLWE